MNHGESDTPDHTVIRSAAPKGNRKFSDGVGLNWFFVQENTVIKEVLKAW